MKIKELIKHLQRLNQPEAEIKIELIRISQNEDEPYRLIYEIEPPIEREKTDEFLLQIR